MKLEITLDEKTWAQLCLLARDRKPDITPERLAHKFIVQDVLNFTRVRAAMGDFVEPTDDDIHQQVSDMNEEVDRRMDS